MRVALAQLDPIVADLEGNLARAILILEEHGNDVDLILLPELFLTGYPPLDLLERPLFLDRLAETVDRLAERTTRYRAAVIVGAAVPTKLPTGKGLYNAALVLRNGTITDMRAKRLLPTYDVFDENRYFDPGPSDQRPVVIAGHKLGLTICEDAFTDSALWPELRYDVDPVADLVRAGADTIINLSASPFVLGKDAMRFQCMAGHAKRHHVSFVYVNQIAGNDELIFDGNSFAVDPNGRLLTEPSPFAESVLVCELPDPTRPAVIPSNQSVATTGDGVTASGLADGVTASGLADGMTASGLADGKTGGTTTNHDERPAAPTAPADATSWPGLATEEALRRALTLGLADYVHKCGFSSVVLGLSGGIDSAVVCCLAAEALGPKNVMGIAMPSVFSAGESLELARTLAENLSVRFEIIPIHDPFEAYKNLLAPHLDWKDGQVDLAQENLQARIRGNILMAFSNRTGSLVLSTGNKSELAVGYCTLYGDMSGGLAVISDVPKVLVYRLAEHINRDREIIPNRIITRPPSAELRPDQKDEDSLPPYPVLDTILKLHVEDKLGGAEIVAAGHDPQIVSDVLRLIQRNEYKRRQAAPGLKVTSKSFGMGRRMPIAARFTP